MGSMPDITGSQVASTVAALLLCRGKRTDPLLLPEGLHPSPCMHTSVSHAIALQGILHHTAEVP